ncbi:phosphogluconate dehydrogenase (NAD(+)-dependent, decarboxylating) [Sulfobacillus thermosulfidooxidans]|uniref:phosphogluconate dehydrogenase (NAD(+)-dependent, decarboxylating) n=1 Tax=Sulfobacillus thermosulfidooxidans TaxID=28034 RepID=UPI00096BCD2A|nr:decarboxylating 6-phosphogluconate dehydrogenase [Sulfobacillus thermosulfidooxidans]OLZ11969.1 6-phosphogluconate dehydrogenase (decarboxylating) [Sulfobacillus thermosulfidooxidans]OLZ17652.1 6-phosphogluconate dehydrogenase (decarboxylating) [Sulfobacillus thermosulfidooxidans]OLZ22433.1 6-phosphogluconate dehydrogenase (decarboxylating) [Sulfobacillus thermosulfidooxidans]
MKMGMLGLGRMGSNMAQRLLRHGHEVVVWNRTPDKVRELEQMGAIGASSIQNLVEQLPHPRVAWMMVPAGEATETLFETLISLLSAHDIVIDGGNANFRDSMRRGQRAAELGIEFIDAGTSGGIWGLANGYAIMAGGSSAAIEHVRPLMESLAPEDGFLHVGPIGSGHFVKMVHNGIEYGLLQAYAEGFEIMKKGPFELDLAAISHIWNHGSVVRSWLLELVENVFSTNPDLKGIRGYVEDSGEGRWTVEEAIKESVPAPVITLSLMARFASRQEESYSAQVIAALRNAFGGHAIKHDPS